ncbi:craniofacial development protein 2-like [Zophobas morio]|uniref:craniofacial development protein 2-like n=1 Tax=Zophobas morio TaxID=2755281 RepID=UPI003083179B
MTTYAKLMDDPIGITKRKKNPKIRIGTWNVRGTYSEGKLKQIVQELQRYNIDVAAIQETKQKGKFITEIDNYILFNSGIDNRELETGFMVKKSLKGAYRKISLVNIHAPTEEKDLEVKTEYYEELEREYVKIPKHGIKMVIGDANAMIGKENCYRPTIGKESKHQKTNQNREKLIEFAEENKMVVKSTFFAQKEIYKGTWMSPDGKTVNQIDHILVERRDAQLITRLRSYRGAEANSDHFLVRADLKQEIPKKKEGKKTQRDINVNKLKKGEVQQEYEQKINERIRSTEQDIPIEESWEELQENIWKTSEEVLGFVKKDNKNRNEWFDEECRKAIEAGRSARQKYLKSKNEKNQKDYQEKRKEYKKIYRNKKRAKMEEQIRQIEENFNKNEIRNFYQDVKKEKRGYQPRSKGITKKGI